MSPKPRSRWNCQYVKVLALPSCWVEWHVKDCDCQPNHTAGCIESETQRIAQQRASQAQTTS